MSLDIVVGYCVVRSYVDGWANQALDLTELMHNSILYTNQARHNGVIINDIPKVIDESSTQSIMFPMEGVYPSKYERTCPSCANF